jgi:hypothetical protein
MATVAVKLQKNAIRDWSGGTYGAPVFLGAHYHCLSGSGKPVLLYQKIIVIIFLLAQVLRIM